MPSNNKYDGMPWMDIYIEVYNIYPDGYDTLSYLVNTNPIRRPNWKTLGLFGGGQAGPFHWALSWGLVIYKTTDTTAYSVTVDGFIESVRIFQGTCDNNQTTGNKVAQNYMFCLEDGTKKIKFT